MVSHCSCFLLTFSLRVCCAALCMSDVAVISRVGGTANVSGQCDCHHHPDKMLSSQAVIIWHFSNKLLFTRHPPQTRHLSLRFLYVSVLKIENGIMLFYIALILLVMEVMYFYFWNFLLLSLFSLFLIFLLMWMNSLHYDFYILNTDAAIFTSWWFDFFNLYFGVLFK